MYPHVIIPLKQHVTVTGARILANPRIVIIINYYFKYTYISNSVPIYSYFHYNSSMIILKRNILKK